MQTCFGLFSVSLLIKMKSMKKWILGLIFTSAIIPAKAQDWSGQIYQTGKIYPGYYVTLSNDTIQGYFQHGTQTSNQKKCLFYTNEMDRKPASEFKPDEIKSYKVADKLYRSINYSGGLMAKPLRFNLVTKDGAITQYIFYAEDGSGSSEGILHKPHDAANSKPVPLSSFALGFAKKMGEYVSDCPELAAKVTGKEKGYGVLALLAIVDEYNECYLKKIKK